MIKLRKQDRYEFRIRYGIFRNGEKSPLSISSTDKKEVEDYAYALNMAVFGTPEKMNSVDKDNLFSVGQINAEKVDLSLEYLKGEASKLFDLEGAQRSYYSGDISLEQVNALIFAANEYIEKNIDFVSEDEIKTIERHTNVIQGINAKQSLDNKAAIKFSVSTTTGGRKNVTLIKVVDEITGLSYHENPVEKPDQTGWNPYTGSSKVSLFKSGSGYKPEYNTSSIETVIPSFLKRHSTSKHKLSDEQLIAKAYESGTKNIQKLVIFLRNIGGTNKQVKRVYPRLISMCNK